VINIDDTQDQFDLHEEVNIKEFYDLEYFPQELWDLKILKRPELFKNIYNDTEYQGNTVIHEKFQVFC
jgi:hypothetical protein